MYCPCRPAWVDLSDLGVDAGTEGEANWGGNLERCSLVCVSSNCSESSLIGTFSVALLPFGEYVARSQSSTTPSAVKMRGAFPLVYAVSNVQFASAREQNWQGWIPSHLILRLRNVSLETSSQSG